MSKSFCRLSQSCAEVPSSNLLTPRCQAIVGNRLPQVPRKQGIIKPSRKAGIRLIELVDNRRTDHLCQIAAHHRYQSVRIDWDSESDTSDLFPAERMPMFTDLVVAPAHSRVFIGI